MVSLSSTAGIFSAMLYQAVPEEIHVCLFVCYLFGIRHHVQKKKKILQQEIQQDARHQKVRMPG